MIEPIVLEKTELRSVAQRISWTKHSERDWVSPGQIAAIVKVINEVRSENEIFQAVVADLERLDSSGLSFDDRVRDLMLSYDITPKES